MKKNNNSTTTSQSLSSPSTAFQRVDTISPLSAPSLSPNNLAALVKIPSMEGLKSVPTAPSPTPSVNGGTSAAAAAAKRQQTPAFLEKLFDILEDVNNAYTQYISWQPDGNSFIIKRVNEFSEVVLPKYFKHSNIQSYIRQLNMYGFSKTRHDSNHHEFTHKLFQRGRRDLLPFIRRKTQQTTRGGNSSGGNTSSALVTTGGAATSSSPATVGGGSGTSNTSMSAATNASALLLGNVLLNRLAATANNGSGSRVVGGLCSGSSSGAEDGALTTTGSGRHYPSYHHHNLSFGSGVEDVDEDGFALSEGERDGVMTVNSGGTALETRVMQLETQLLMLTEHCLELTSQHNRLCEALQTCHRHHAERERNWEREKLEIENRVQKREREIESSIPQSSLVSSPSSSQVPTVVEVNTETEKVSRPKYVTVNTGAGYKLMEIDEDSLPRRPSVGPTSTVAPSSSCTTGCSLFNISMGPALSDSDNSSEGQPLKRMRSHDGSFYSGSSGSTSSSDSGTADYSSFISFSAAAAASTIGASKMSTSTTTDTLPPPLSIPAVKRESSDSSNPYTAFDRLEIEGEFTATEEVETMRETESDKIVEGVAANSVPDTAAPTTPANATTASASVYADYDFTSFKSSYSSLIPTTHGGNAASGASSGHNLQGSMLVRENSLDSTGCCVLNSCDATAVSESAGMSIGSVTMSNAGAALKKSYSVDLGGLEAITAAADLLDTQSHQHQQSRKKKSSPQNSNRSGSNQGIAMSGGPLVKAYSYGSVVVPSSSNVSLSSTSKLRTNAETIAAASTVTPAATNTSAVKDNKVNFAVKPSSATVISFTDTSSNSSGSSTSTNNSTI